MSKQRPEASNRPDPSEPVTGGCTVLENPNRSGAETLVFWTADLLPGMVRLSPAPPGNKRGAAGVDPWWGASRRAFLEDGNGFHIALAHGPRERRFWIEGKRLPNPGTPLRALIAFDGDMDAQMAAVRRFHELITDPAAPPDLTPYQERMLVHALQALDAHLDGASLRDTAEALFGAGRVKADWYRDSPLRDRIRYLVRRGRQLMEGGYRDLLAGRVQREKP